jgi:hypothetical protein
MQLGSLERSQSRVAPSTHKTPSGIGVSLGSDSGGVSFGSDSWRGVSLGSDSWRGVSFGSDSWGGVSFGEASEDARVHCAIRQRYPGLQSVSARQ